MTVEQFDQKAPKKSNNSADSQTTTPETPRKIIAEQAKTQINASNGSSKESVRDAKIGFLSLG